MYRYKVFQVTPSSYIQTKELMSWESKPGIDFWREPRSLGDSADVMVNPENLYQFQTFLDQQNLKWKIVVDDVEKYSLTIFTPIKINNIK